MLMVPRRRQGSGQGRERSVEPARQLDLGGILGAQPVRPGQSQVPLRSFLSHQSDRKAVEMTEDVRGLRGAIRPRRSFMSRALWTSTTTARLPRRRVEAAKRTSAMALDASDGTVEHAGSTPRIEHAASGRQRLPSDHRPQSITF